MGGRDAKEEFVAGEGKVKFPFAPVSFQIGISVHFFSIRYIIKRCFDWIKTFVHLLMNINININKNKMGAEIEATVQVQTAGEYVCHVFNYLPCEREKKSICCAIFLLAGSCFVMLSCS